MPSRWPSPSTSSASLGPRRRRPGGSRPSGPGRGASAIGWSPIPRDRNSACLLCQFNKLTGLEGISPGRQPGIRPDPDGQPDRRPGHPVSPRAVWPRGPVKAEPGITAKWGLTPNLILNAAANPDFSQVEADVAQLDVNKRFALYYPRSGRSSSRGRDFFLTPIQAVFTRTVADPVWGMKLTGKSGRSALGFFAAQDRINNLIFPSNQGSSSTSLDERRHRRGPPLPLRPGQGSTLGLLYTGRAGGGYAQPCRRGRRVYPSGSEHQPRVSVSPFRDRIPGLDRPGLRPETGHVRGRCALRRVPPPRRGTGGSSELARMLGRGFRADAGFMPRVDTRTVDAMSIRLFWGDGKSWFTGCRFWLRGLLHRRTTAAG